MSDKTNPLQIVSVIVVIKCSKKYLLVQRHEADEVFPGKWQNVGGKVELGETIEEAIKREVKEEVGIRVKGRKVFLQSYSWKKDRKSSVRLGLIFLVNLSGKPSDHKIKLNEELADCDWFEVEKAKEFNRQNKLIGRGSPTGTFSQLLKAEIFT